MRSDVQNWVDEWKNNSPTGYTLEDYIRMKVSEMLEGTDPTVVRTDGEDAAPVHVADKILEDLDSYAAGS